jgi:hypothetical protein
MDLSTRIEIAQWTYQQALEEVRREQTSTTWAHLLRAAKNLRDAIAEAEKLDRQPSDSHHA